MQQTYLLSLLSVTARVFASQHCKLTPWDANWPSSAEWESLNSSIDGMLISTVPVASSCWPGNPFGSPVSCDSVKADWTNAIWQSVFPESVDYPIYANNSCLPPGAAGYLEDRGCTVGGLPQFIVNATTEEQVATAMKWAAARNIRIVVKGTGHDLNGRSSGAFALSIWTSNFRNLKRNKSWLDPATQLMEDVFIVGSGQQWGNVLSEALQQGRVVTTGQDPSVGLGGYIQGGGHGPLSSTYGLASSHVLQLTVVTTEGHILVANGAQNQDIFWALRGGGPGQYGVVTEYVIRHHPVPKNVTMGTLKIVPASSSNRSVQLSWDAAVTVLRALPDLMDAGLAGAATLATGEAALSFAPGLQGSTSGVVLTQVFWSFNVTSAAMGALVDPVISNIKKQQGFSNNTLSVSFTMSSPGNYSSFYDAISGSNDAGGESLVSSRLLGRAELVEIPQESVVTYVKTAMHSQNQTAGTYATIGLQAGPGVRNTPQERWGALLPAWRSAYLHFISGGATIDSIAAGSPKVALQNAAEWIEEVKEKMWREWAPNSGAYMNEANPYNENFEHDYYGSNYDSLLQVKKKYDPSESLFILSGVGSDKWQYDLDSGKLCKTD